MRANVVRERGKTKEKPPSMICGNQTFHPRRYKEAQMKFSTESLQQIAELFTNEIKAQMEDEVGAKISEIENTMERCYERWERIV